MRKMMLTVLVVIIVMSCFLLPTDDFSNIKSGRIVVNNKKFTYFQTIFNINVISADKNIVFHSESKDNNEIILSFGYSVKFNSFYIFKQQFDSKSKKFTLWLETEENSYKIINSSSSCFYSPILVDYDKTYSLFITEDFSIVIMDFQTGKIINIIRSKTPIFKLEKLKIKNSNSTVIKFLAFSEGIYKPRYIKFESQYNSGNSRIFAVFDYMGAKREHIRTQTPKHRTIISSLLLSEDKFLCFGDSITYGFINKEPAQSLGYVPRLDEMINENLYKAVTINEGYPGTQTYEALAIFDDIIKKHNAKYLLFHYGTNDAIHMEVPISSVLFNIKYMMESSIDYGISSIISTLIPRNGWTGEGILRSRAIQISEGIKDIAKSLNIPIVDFWDLFSSYPESEGGYISLMSDNVHPSEEGYQLMAINWFDLIKTITIEMPTNIHVVKKTQTVIKIAWDDNIAEEFSHWVIKFSFFNKDLVYSVSTAKNSYEFYINPFSNKSLYFKIKAVYNNQVSSAFSDVFEIKLRN